MNKHTRTLIILFLLVSVLNSACQVSANPTAANKAPANTSKDTAPIKVIASFDAMSEFVKAVGKERVDVTTMVPAGSEAHSFEPKPQDLVALSKSKLFVYNGAGMESWAEDAIKAANNPDLIVVDTSKGADLLPAGHEDEEGHEEHDHGGIDPHLWLSPSMAQFQAKNILDALVQADPQNELFYKNNYEEFKKSLDDLLKEYQEKISKLENRYFVTGHAAFAYLCRDLGLKQQSVEGVFGSSEPTAQALAQLVEFSKEHKISTVFSEEMASPEVSASLAKEIGAKVETIYTMEGPQDGLSYLDRMQSNLEKIYQSLVP